MIVIAHLLSLAFAIHPPPTIVNEPTSKDVNTMLTYAAIAYCKTGLDTWTCGPRCQQVSDTSDVSWITKNFVQTNAFVAYSKSLNSIIVSFRGTETRLNLVSDLLTNQVPLDYISGVVNTSVHLGFLTTYLPVRDQIKKAIRNLILKYPRASLRFTGHSMVSEDIYDKGASIAAIAVSDLAHQLPDRIIERTRLFTYGQPRIFASLMNKFGDDRIFRITNKQDVVTNIPPRNLFGKDAWLHHGTEYNFDRNHVLRKCFGDEDPNCSISGRETLNDQITGIVTLIQYFSFLNVTSADVKAHYLASYSNGTLAPCNDAVEELNLF